MLTAASTEARELDFLVDSILGADTNVFRRSHDRVEDGFWEFSPRVGLRETRDNLQYDFNYRPTFQTFFDTDGIDGWNHFGAADFNWSPTQAESISFGGEFVSSRFVRQFADEDLSVPPDDPGRTIIRESGRQRIARSTARIGYNRSLNAATSARINFRFDDIDFNSGTNVDSRGYALSLGSTRVLDERTQVGFLVTGRFRDGRGIKSKGQFSSKTLTGELSLSFVRTLSPSMTLSIQGGPSFIKTEQNAPPLGDADPGTPQRDRTSNNNNLTYVANVSLEKAWRKASASLTYTRFQSGTGGTSSASNVDQLTLKLDHHPSRRLTLTMNLSWIQRKTITSVGRTNSQDSLQYSVSTSAIYKISRQFSVIGRASFRRIDYQTQVSVLPSRTTTRATNIFLGTLTLRYSFDPIIF